MNDDGESVTTPALGYGVFCRSDRDMIARTLSGIPEQWVRVHQELSIKAAGTERVSGSRSAPIPANMAADAILREVIAVLVSWEECVRVAAGLTLPDTQLARRRRDSVAVTGAVRTLSAHLDRLVALPAAPMSRAFELHNLERIPEGAYGRTNTIGGYCEVTVDLSGVDAAEEILSLSRRCKAFVGDTRMREALNVPCPDPSCSGFSLEHIQGSAYAAECRACGRLMTTGELGTWTKIFTAGLDHRDIPASATEREREEIVALLAARNFKSTAVIAADLPPRAALERVTLPFQVARPGLLRCAKLVALRPGQPRGLADVPERLRHEVRQFRRCPLRRVQQNVRCPAIAEPEKLPEFNPVFAARHRVRAPEDRGHLRRDVSVNGEQPEPVVYRLGVLGQPLDPQFQPAAEH